MAGLLPNLFSALAVVGVGVAALGSATQGWADAVVQAGDSRWGPAMSIEIELGWWNSTTHFTGWIPGQFEVSDKAARALGTITVVCLVLGLLVALHHLVLEGTDSFAFPLPVRVRSTTDTRFKLFSFFGPLCLIMTMTLLLALMIGTHKKIKDQTGVNVWPTPDWAAGSSMIGSFALTGVAYCLRPAGDIYNEYMPI